MVCKDQLMDGRKTRTMRPVTTKTWQKVYKTFTDIENANHIQGMGLFSKYYKIPLSLYWSPESLCPNCKQYSIFPVSKGIHICHLCQMAVSLPSKMFRKKRKLFDAVLTNITKRTLGSLTNDECIADGFSDAKPFGAKYEMYKWFAETYELGDVWITQNPFSQGNDQLNPKLEQFEVFVIEFRRVSP
jgi:hypothetical protein